MVTLRGEGASRGIAVGPAHLLAAKVAVAERRILRQDRVAEVARLEEGLAAADEQLDRLQRRLTDERAAGADLVQAHRLMLRSPEIAGESRRLILDECSAVRLMLPLVTSVTELRRALEICANARDELSAEGVAFDPHVPLGIMLETPSAALTADLLAPSVDFFNIGSNDLIQYACAADRENSDVAHLRNPFQPAVLRLLKQAVDAATRAQLPISICGDVASDPAFAWVLLGLGLRDLSLEPHAIPMVKAIIRRSSMEEATALAARALASPDEQETKRLIEVAMRPKFAADLEAFMSTPEA